MLTLYKAFYKTVPFLVKLNKSSIPTAQVQQQVKNEFARNRYDSFMTHYITMTHSSNISDTRAIELLLAKGQMDLQELEAGFAQETHFHRKWDQILQNDPKRNDFISKFLREKH